MVSIGGVDLDIDNYDLNDLLDLFKIDSIDNEANLAQAKMITLKMHPDKSGLDKEYFLFFSKAYKILYQLYVVQDKTREKGQSVEYKNHNVSLDKDNHIILDKLIKEKKTSEEFNEWFNREFEAMKLKDDFTDNGYGDWLSNDSVVVDNEKCKNMEMVHDSIEKRRKELYKVVKHNDILEYNDGGYCDIGNNAPENYSSEMFSSLAFQDLKQAHTETVMPVNEKDALERQYSMDQIKAERGMKIQPIDEKEAKNIVNSRHREENKNNVQRMYKLIKQQEEVKKNNNEWWKKYKLIK